VNSLWDQASPQLRQLGLYEPGKPIEETARELGVDPNEVVKLASNENPLGPSPKAVAAMRSAIESAELYPDGGGFFLRTALASRLGCTLDNIILGNGSNEIIEFLGHAFLKPGDAVLAFEHAFIAYKLIAGLFGARTVEVASQNFQPNVHDLLNAITAKTKIIFIANPNNPTGALIAADKIDDFLMRVPDNVITVVDQAYLEFLDRPPDVVRHVHENRNVVVLRTFSKIYGLAGLRVGYAIARREIIDILRKTRQPFNVNGVGQTAALAALDDEEHVRKTKAITDEGRFFLETQLSAMNLRFIPSAGNFVCVNVGNGGDIFKKMLARKIIVRPLHGYNLPEWLRISVGTMEQNQKCIAALKEALI
jgi:histidinol-phosphate aminotransferase